VTSVTNLEKNLNTDWDMKDLKYNPLSINNILKLYIQKKRQTIFLKMKLFLELTQRIKAILKIIY